MKITFEEVLSRKEWLHSELLSSLTSEVFDTLNGDQFYDVKLVVNGIEIEPTIFNNIMNNIEKIIDDEAKSLVRDKFDEVENKINQLSNIFSGVKDKLIDDYNLDINEY